MSEELIQEQLSIIAKAVTTIQQIDKRWKTPHSTDNGHPLKIIEAGSTGVFEGYVDEFGYWAYDGETYPSWPLLVMWND